MNLEMAISAIVSFAVAIILQKILNLFSSKVRKIPKEIKEQLIHTWRHHYFNISDSGKIKYFDNETWVITKNIFGSIKISVKNEYDNSAYSGYMEYENGYLLVTLKSGTEKLFFRIPSKMLGDSKVHPKLITFGSARDYTDKASANVTILSKTSLTEDDFKTLVENKVSVYQEERLMVINK